MIGIPRTGSTPVLSPGCVAVVELTLIQQGDAGRYSASRRQGAYRNSKQHVSVCSIDCFDVAQCIRAAGIKTALWIIGSLRPTAFAEG